MALQAIPKVSLLIATGEKAVVDDPNNVPVMNKTVPEGLNPAVLATVESIAKDYVYNLGLKFTNTATARLTCSVEHGVEFDQCSDPRMREYYLNNSILYAALPIIQVRQIGRIHMVQLPLEKREEIQRQYEEEHVFVDSSALMFFKMELKEPVTVDLEVNPFKLLGESGGITTANMRFPHMLLRMQERLDTREHSPSSRICIVGPGLLENKEESCPQFVEIFALFPKGRFTLLDNDPRVLEVMPGLQDTSYDPLMLRLYSINSKKNPKYLKDRKYQNLFQRMKDHLGERAIAPKDARKILAGYGEVQPLTLQLDLGQVAKRHFDINTTQFIEEDRFDIIVATLSITNATQQELKSNPKANHFFKLAKFLNALNEGGSLYIDSLFIDALKRYGPGFELGMRYLETLVGNKLEIEEIPLPNFLGKKKGALGTIASYSSSELKEDISHQYDVTTTAITVITRTRKKVDPSQKIEAAMALVQFLKAMQIEE